MATVLTNKGRDIVTGRISGLGSYNVPNYMGWGTGAGTAAVADTTLFTEAPNVYSTANSARPTAAQAGGAITQQTGDQAGAGSGIAAAMVQIVGTLTANSTVGITNAGIFEDAGSGTTPSGGDLFLKGDFTVINLVSGDSIQFTWKLQAN